MLRGREGQDGKTDNIWAVTNAIKTLKPGEPPRTAEQHWEALMGYGPGGLMALEGCSNPGVTLRTVDRFQAE